MTTLFKKLYKLAEGLASNNDEMYMPQPFGDDVQHKSTLDPINPEPLEISQPKEDGNQFTGSKRTADFANSDTNPSPSNISAPEKVYTMDVEAPPEQQMFGDAGETSRGDNSIVMSSLGDASTSREDIIDHLLKDHQFPKTLLNEPTGTLIRLHNDKHNNSIMNVDPFNETPNHQHTSSKNQGSMNSQALRNWIIDNGQPQCSYCKEYYRPSSIAHAKVAHCGHCAGDILPHDVEEGDVVDGDVVKTSSKGAGKITQGSDSELYVRGYLDHLHGKPLDEDLAVLSDDYFNGYDQARYYGKTPIESVGAKPHHVTTPEHIDTSLEGWGQSGIGGQDYHYDVDRSQVIASTLPTKVLEKFFDTEE